MTFAYSGPQGLPAHFPQSGSPSKSYEYIVWVVSIVDTTGLKTRFDFVIKIVTKLVTKRFDFPIVFGDKQETESKGCGTSDPFRVTCPVWGPTDCFCINIILTRYSIFKYALDMRWNIQTITIKSHYNYNLLFQISTTNIINNSNTNNNNKNNNN